ncbi:hypothetical protein ACH6YM_24815, partial [Klebsiella pneumoniae]|nr:hypothetical protein [Klebsiella pneumoniae]
YGAKKRYGWATAEPWKELTEHECRTCIRDSLAKGKLIDAMNYLMFAHLNGHTLLSLRNPPGDEQASVDSQMRDQLANALGVTGRSWDEMLAMVSVEKSQAFQLQKTIESISKELKLDPETPADRIISTVHFLVKHSQNAITEVNITGCTDPDMLENLAKAMRVNSLNPRFDGGVRASWPHMILPAGADAELKWPRTKSPEGAGETRKTALPKAMAAPYGVKASKKRQQYELTMEADDSGIPSPLFIFRRKKDRDDYLPLLRTFLGALEQAAYGKGRERHANDLPFVEQPILAVARMLNSDAGLAQQVIKKTNEARGLPTKHARIKELRGAMVYAAAMVLFEEMYGRADDPDELDEIDL